MIGRTLKLAQILLHAVAGESSPRVRSASMRWLRRLLDGVPSEWTQPPEHGDFLPGHPAQAGYRPAGGRVLLVGDAQIHHFAGDPDSTSNFLDPWTEPSARPALQGLFGDRLLSRLLREHLRSGRYQMVIFLGDALNTSCEAELKRFDAVVRTLFGAGGEFASVPFVVLPGNHDGLLYGNLGAREPRAWLDKPGAWRKAARWLLNAQSWEWTCRCSDEHDERHGARAGRVDRNRFHDYQAGLLGALQRPSPWPVTDGGWQPWPVEGVALQWFEGGRAGARHWAARYVDRRAPHRSFLLQLVELPAMARGDDEDDDRAFAIIFDTSNHGYRPRAAGLIGGIGRLQQIAAKALVVRALAAKETRHGAAPSSERRRAPAGEPPSIDDQSNGERPAAPARLIFAGHHNLHALPLRARWLLTHLLLDLTHGGLVAPLPLYVSAHRHRGGWYSHRVNEHALSIGRQVRWTDLNVSSLVDWPIAARDLRLWQRPGAAPARALAESWQLAAAGTDDLRAAARTDDPRAVAMIPPSAARTIGERDARAQRSNVFRQQVAWRLRSMRIDPERDAYCADYAMLCISARTLLALHDAVRVRAASDDAGRRASIERLDEAAAALDGSGRPKPLRMFREWSRQPAQWKAMHRGLRMAVVRYRAELLDLMDACDDVDELVCQSVVWSAVEDRYQSSAGHENVPVGIGERWYREALNLSEPFARLPVMRATDARVASGWPMALLQVAGRPGAIGTRIAERHALWRSRERGRSRASARP